MIGLFFQFLRTRIHGAEWPAAWTLPKWQSHRGFHLGHEKENTLGSLIAATTMGATMCEFDVRLTKDEVPVLFHDIDLLRLTGHPGLLSEIRFSDLKEIYPINSLEEVLLSDQVSPYLNIELKSEQILNDPLERRVAEVVKKTKSSERILFSSFNPVSLWKMTTFLPTVPRALLIARDLQHRLLREMALAPFLKIHAMHFEDVLLPNAEAISMWQSRGLCVGVWTVNEAEKIRQYMDWGIDSVITDLIPENPSGALHA